MGAAASKAPREAQAGQVRRDRVVRDRVEGPIECGTLIVEQGGSVIGNVRAERVVVRGTMRGLVRTFSGFPSEFSVARGGRFDGEAHMSSIQVAGRSSGILHGKVVRLDRTAEATGAIVADEFHSHSETRVRAMVFSGKGMSGVASRGLIDGLRGLVSLPVLSGAPDGRPSADNDQPPAAAAAPDAGEEGLVDLDLEAFERDLAVASATAAAADVAAPAAVAAVRPVPGPALSVATAQPGPAPSPALPAVPAPPVEAPTPVAAAPAVSSPVLAAAAPLPVPVVEAPAPEVPRASPQARRLVPFLIAE